MFATVYSDHAQKCSDEYMNMRKYELYKQQMETQKLKQQYMANPHLASASTNFYQQANLSHHQNPLNISSSAKMPAPVANASQTPLDRHKSSNVISPTNQPLLNSHQRTSLSNLTNNSNQMNCNNNNNTTTTNINTSNNNNTSISNLNSPVSHNSSINQYHQSQHYSQQMPQNDAYQQSNYSNTYYEDNIEFRYQAGYQNGGYQSQTLSNNFYQSNYNNGASFNAGQVAPDSSQTQPQSELYQNMENTPQQANCDAFNDSSNCAPKNESFNSSSTNTNDAASCLNTAAVDSQPDVVEIIETICEETSNLDELLLDHELILEHIFSTNVNPIKFSSIEQIENELRSYCTQNNFF